MSSPLPYFPRHPLDAICLGHLENVKGLAMFAPRRRGKTAFVNNELIPGAQNRGYDTVYIDLWRSEATPELAIVEGLERALPAGKWALTKVKATGKAKPPLAEFGGELEAKPVDTSPDTLVGRVNAALDRMAKAKRLWLVVIDEFQALTAAKEPGFVAALRSGIQGAANIRLFVTGSSRRQLTKMLTSQKSPFLGMLMQIDLPELEMDFIKNRCELILERTRRKVDPMKLMGVFEKIVRVPEYLNQIVSIMIVEGVYDPDKGYDLWRSRLGAGEAAMKWETLSELDKLVVMLIGGRPGIAMFSEETIAWLNKKLPGEQVKASKIQTSIRRLDRGHLVEPGAANGEYEIGDDGMRLFLAELPPVSGMLKPPAPRKRR